MGGGMQKDTSNFPAQGHDRGAGRSIATPLASETGKDATRKLARHAATLRYEALPHALVERTKQCVLDTLGVTIGASGLAPEAKIVADYVRDLGGKPESTIMGFGYKAPALWAAFVNGSLSHMLDYDDISNGGHVSIATVPVACVLAEKLGAVSGRDLIAAIAAGADLHIRLDQSVDIPEWEMAEGWFATQLLGFISGTATAGRLLRLDEGQMENAFGIAFNQLSGSRQMAVGASTHMRSMESGFSGQAAILAAQLASRGIIGSKEIIEGRYGLFKTYIRTNTPHWETIVGGLGTRFPLLDPYAQNFKVWPACAYTHPVNAAILELQRDFALKADEVDSITVIGGIGATPLLFEPIERKRRPQTSVDGKYSLPFTAAVMMLRGNVTPRDYTNEGLKDAAVLALADRVHYRREERIGGADAAGGSAAGNERQAPTHPSSVSRPAVEVLTKDGRLLTRRPVDVPGDSKLPASQDFLEAKFRDCVSCAAKPIAAGNIDRAIDMIRRLETIPDVTEIVRLLA